jgi:hypothetical protein
VLFFAAGLIASDREAFDAATDRIVAKLGSSPTLAPYNYLCQSINFWRLFVPAAERSLSVRGDEAFLETEFGNFGLTVPPVVSPPATGDLGRQHLLYAVGLPVLAHKNVPFATLRDEFSLTTQVDLSRVNNQMIDVWRDLADRMLTVEVDASQGSLALSRGRCRRYEHAGAA